MMAVGTVLTASVLAAAIAVSALAASRMIATRRYSETLGCLALGAGLAKGAFLLAGGGHG